MSTDRDQKWGLAKAEKEAVRGVAAGARASEDEMELAVVVARAKARAAVRGVATGARAREEEMELVVVARA